MKGLLGMLSLFYVVEPADKCEQSRAIGETGVDELHEYDITCGGKRAMKGSLKAPVIPKLTQYPNYCDCTWVIGSGYDGISADVEITFLHLEIEGSTDNCQGDYLQITSSNGATFIRDKLCGNIMPNKIVTRAILPVKITFISDLDLQAHTGFSLEYEVVPDTASGSKSLRIVDDIDYDEEVPEKANIGLIIGIMILVIVAMSSVIYVLCQRNKRLKLEARGPPPLELADVGMYATENIYESLPDVSSTLLRTESKDSIALAKEAAQNENRALPPLPTD